MKRIAFAIFTSVCLAASVQTQPSVDTVPVTADNFTRAETDSYFANIVKNADGVGKFFHRREIEPVDNQIVIRGNRDTVYSAAVFDLDAGPVTVTLPNADNRFMSLIVIDQDQYTPAVYYGGSHSFDRQQIGTRYLMLALRTFVDPSDPEDLKKVHALQDAVKISQPSPGTFEIPKWDPATHKKVKDALLVLYATVPDQNRMFGTKAQVDPVRRLIGSAGGWAEIPIARPNTSTSIRAKTMARRSTSSPSKTPFTLMVSGQSPFTMRTAAFRKTNTTPIRSTI
jgi:hypothetical protein